MVSFPQAAFFCWFNLRATASNGDGRFGKVRFEQQSQQENVSTESLENVEPAARHTTALIVEGGAMRGAWAAGVLAFLHEQGRHHYDLVYAASSGACSAAYFVADMWQPGLAIWRELACKCIRKTNVLRHKPFVDLAYLVDHIMRQRVPLSVEALQTGGT